MNLQLLFWLTGLIFAALLPWGTNVPIQGKAVLVKWLVIVNIVVHVITQGFIFETAVSAWSTQEERSRIAEKAERYEKYLDVVALTPSEVDNKGDWCWGQMITANLVHAGWLHLALNLWLFALYGPNLEELFGRRRFAVFLVAAMLGTQLAILLLTRDTDAYRLPHRGFSGVVYAVIAAYLVCFPRSRIKVALIYDFKFWAAVAFLVVPVVYLFGMRSSSMAELLLLIGVVGTFILLQPDHARFGVPAFALLGYKLLQDAITVQQQADNRVSIWGHVGGLAVGTVAGLMVNGFKGLRQTWDEPEDMKKEPRRRDRDRVNLAKMEKAAQTDESVAKAYLGQRIFVGDAVRATEFYVNTAMPTFPGIQLDPRELHSLARMLEFKGQDAAALHAYEKLANTIPLPAGYEDVYLSAAKYCHLVQPERAVDALRYLKQFEDNSHMMRDRMEARRYRAEILEAARVRGEDAPVLLRAADDEASAAKLEADPKESSDYTGKPAVDRRKTARTTSRVQKIESGDKHPPVSGLKPEASAQPPVIQLPVAAPREVKKGESANAEEAKVEQSDGLQAYWGKKRLPLKTKASAIADRAKREASNIGEANSLGNPQEIPTLPASIEKLVGLKKPQRLDLTGMDLPEVQKPEPESEPPPLPSAQPTTGPKELDFTYGSVSEPDAGKAEPANMDANVSGGSETMSSEEQHVVRPMLRPSSEENVQGTQRDSVMKIGAEYATSALAPGKVEAGGSHAVYGSEAGSGGSQAGSTAAAELMEVLSIDLLDSELVFNTMEKGRVRVAVADVAFVQVSAVQLSRREGVPARMLIEVVSLGEMPRRLQLHERTFTFNHSHLRGEPLRLTNLPNLAEMISEIVGGEKVSYQDAEISYPDHEALVVERIKAITGE